MARKQVRVHQFTNKPAMQPKDVADDVIVMRVPWRDTLTDQERHEIEVAEKIGRLRPVGAGPNNLLPKLARLLDEMELLIDG